MSKTLKKTMELHKIQPTINFKTLYKDLIEIYINNKKLTDMSLDSIIKHLTENQIPLKIITLNNNNLHLHQIVKIEYLLDNVKGPNIQILDISKFSGYHFSEIVEQFLNSIVSFFNDLVDNNVIRSKSIIIEKQSIF